MPMSLDEIERRYLRYLLTTGKSKPTMTNYHRFFVNLRDFAAQRDFVIDTDHLDTELVREFHATKAPGGVLGTERTTSSTLG